MSNFKFGSSTTFKNWLVAPKGYSFNTVKIKESNLFSLEQKNSLSFSFHNKSMQWVEEGVNFSSHLTPDDWKELINIENGYLIKEE